MKPPLVLISKGEGKITYRTYADGKKWPGVESGVPLLPEDVEMLRLDPVRFGKVHDIDLETP